MIAALPVVALNVSKLRCDALIIHGGEIEVVELSVGVDDARDRSLSWLDECHADRPDAQRLHDTLKWMWEGFGAGIVERLEATGLATATEAPRVWWIPTDALTALPVHAAGHYQHERRESLLHRLRSSYTTTIRTLAEQLRRPAAWPNGSDPLIVGLRNPSDEQLRGTPHLADRPLRFAEAEAEEVATTHGCEAVIGSRATTATILERLSRAGFAHFACHGRTAWEDPSASGLHLHDGLLTAHDLLDVWHPEAWLVMLSACGTAHPGVMLLDQATSVATAFQFAGFRHVVGSLWPIDDQVAYHQSVTFHERLTEGTDTDPATILHDIAVAGCESDINHPLRWTTMVHYGP